MSSEDVIVNPSQAASIPTQTTLHLEEDMHDDALYSSSEAELEEAQACEAESIQPDSSAAPAGKKYIAYTIKLPSEQLSALQSIWLELKRLYGVNSPDKSGMIQQAVAGWLKDWDSTERTHLLNELLEIREDTRRRQYRKSR